MMSSLKMASLCGLTHYFIWGEDASRYFIWGEGAKATLALYYLWRIYRSPVWQSLCLILAVILNYDPIFPLLEHQGIVCLSVA